MLCSYPCNVICIFNRLYQLFESNFIYIFNRLYQLRRAYIYNLFTSSSNRMFVYSLVHASMLCSMTAFWRT